MRITRRIAALALLSLLALPNVAVAESRDEKCDTRAAQQEEECKEKRGRGFSTRFFG